MSQHYFAITTPGLEEPLLQEIRQIGGRKARIAFGGVEFEGTNAVFYRANYLLRCCQRVLLRVDEFRARDAPELYNKTRRYEWDRLIAPKQSLLVKASAHQSRLIHTDVIASAVFDGVRDYYKKELKKPAPRLADKPGANTQVLMARLVDDRCTLSLDGSGDLLHRRGWRQKVGAAPIRETTAAALLRLADWQPDEPVYDPMCGSGTFVIEAAQMAAGIAAGKNREFAFWKWPNFNDELWQKVVREADAAMEQNVDKRYFGSDVEPGMIQIAQENATAAGVASYTTFEQASVEGISPPAMLSSLGKPGLVICNPPYGERLSMDETQVMEQLISRFASEFKGWRLAIVLPIRMKLPGRALKFEERARFKNGGIPVKFMVAQN